MKLSFVFLLTLLFSISTFAQSFQKKEVEKNTFKTQIKVEGDLREFIVRLPGSFSPSESYPVVMIFHGGGGSGQKFYQISKWRELGDKEGIITVFPTALSTCVIKDGVPSKKNYWMTEGKASSLCDGETPQDDVAFVTEIVNHLKAEYPIDDTRIYATGFSNGMGLILSRLMIDMGDTFAAFAGAGSIAAELPQTANPKPLFCVIGQKDSHLGKWAEIDGPVSDVHQLLDETRMPERVEVILTSMQLESTFVERDRPKYVLRRYAQTTNGGNQELRFGVLKDLGHVYPHGGPKHNDVIIAKVFWDFFQEV